MATSLERAGAARQHPLLTPDEIAEILGVSRQYVLKTLVFERRIDFVKIGGHVRFEPSAVEKLIEFGRTEAAQ